MPTFNFDSVNKFYLSSGMFLLLLSGFIFAYYETRFDEDNLGSILFIYCILFFAGGFVIFVYGLIKFTNEERDKEKYAQLLKEEKWIDIRYKQLLLDEKIEELRQKNKYDKRISLLEEIKRHYDKEGEVFAKFTPSSTITFSSGTVLPIVEFGEGNNQKNIR